MVPTGEGGRGGHYCCGRVALNPKFGRPRGGGGPGERWRRDGLVLEDMVKDRKSVGILAHLTSKQRPYTSATVEPQLRS